MIGTRTRLVIWTMKQLTSLPEPHLLFRHEQSLEDPRDGLTLFGPLDSGQTYGVRWAAMGTRDGLRRLEDWVARLEEPRFSPSRTIQRPGFPGFKAAFRVPFGERPVLKLEVADKDLNRAIMIEDVHQRVYRTVSLFSDPILTATKDEDVIPDVWFVVVPDEVHRYCRPQSRLEADSAIPAPYKMTMSRAKDLINQTSLFPEDPARAEPYYHVPNFRSQLKARLLLRGVVSQIVRESTLKPQDFVDKLGRPRRQLSSPSTLLWNLTSALFYKAGGRPWKLSGVREGVCYVGLVFREDQRWKDPRSACCAAQMFLDSGDGIVFKGALGPWRSEARRGHFHLDREAARHLVSVALESYKHKTGQIPKEIFIHGRVRFNNEEWAGFTDAIPADTNLVGVRILNASYLKLFRQGTHPVLRGLAYIQHDRLAYLWTRGFIPRLGTYPGREVPNPLLVEMVRGDADMEVVLRDILGLTKLNYNACMYTDGVPVTLRFADAVGQVLTSGPSSSDVPPLPFRYYI